MSKQTPPYPLRMPDELREALEGDSTKNKRSLNAEIVARLERSKELEKRTLDEAIAMTRGIGDIQVIEPYREILERLGQIEDALKKLDK